MQRFSKFELGSWGHLHPSVTAIYWDLGRSMLGFFHVFYMFYRAWTRIGFQPTPLKNDGVSESQLG